MADILNALEKKYGVSGNELARMMHIDPSDYHGKLKQAKRVTTAWRIALWCLDHYGVEILKRIFK